MAKEFYSIADQERMARGEEPLEHSELTVEDYKNMLQMALEEAVESSEAREYINNAAIADMGGSVAGATTQAVDENGKMIEKWDVTIDWGSRIQNLCMDEQDGAAWMAQRFSTAFHEVRHVEQRAMLNDLLPVDDKLDREIVTQMTVNDLYPTLYKRGYGNTVAEVDADVFGLEGALEFFDNHPEIKERYGFDFRKEIMRTDEYDLLEDTYQVTEAEPEELLHEMETFRDGVYASDWLNDRAELTADTAPGSKTETSLMEHLEETQGLSFEDLEGMSVDERNVLLIQNAIDTMDSGEYAIASNLAEYREGLVMSARCDEILLDQRVLDESMAAMFSGEEVDQQEFRNTLERLGNNNAAYAAYISNLQPPQPGTGSIVRQRPSSRINRPLPYANISDKQFDDIEPYEGPDLYLN